MLQAPSESRRAIFGGRHQRRKTGGIVSYLSLQRSDEKGFQSLAGLVTVADILERLSGVLSGYVQKNLLTTAVELSVLSDDRTHKIAEGNRSGGLGETRQHRRAFNLRMLIDKLRAVVDLVVDHDKQILLCVVLSNILVGVLLVRHFGWGRSEARGGREKVRRVVSLSVLLETADQCAQEWQRERRIQHGELERKRGNWTSSST